MTTFNRRDFLKIITNALLWLNGILSLGGLLRFLGYTVPEDGPREYDLGPAENYPPGSRSVVADGGAVLIHDESGLYAISTTCTHLGCRVNPSPEGFLCPCHGSRFDLQGNVLNGPAKEHLHPFNVTSSPKGHLILEL